ncbi:hypothetical protein LPJ78_000346 [Coemansia sp. RSA 989]|nr:hypothetical protein LPJ79_001293 [Coemansia sp. RSA 1821]KAJ1868217.1 hypothetical protein LPJ78_000346 [Coemansia sp. RSA 989]
MSEEGEAEFDSGQIPGPSSSAAIAKSPPAKEASDRAPAAGDGNEKPVAMEPAEFKRYPDTDESHRPEYMPRHDSYAPPAADRRYDNDYYRRREVHSRSRSRHSAGFHEPRDRRRESEGDFYGGAYRQSRYGDREYSRGGYYRRYDRGDPRYRRRESGRRGYSRGRYSAREEVDGEYAARRDIDKERAIEELRERVRAGADRPTEDVPLVSRERSRPPSRLSESTSRAPPAVNKQSMADQTKEQQPPVDPTAIGEGPAEAKPAAINMDDLEEGEHVEGAMDVDLPPEPAYGLAEKAPLRGSSRSRDNGRYNRSRSRPYRERSRPRSRSRPRAYPPAYDTDSRRAANYRDHDSTYRRRYDDRADRYDSRFRDGRRSGYSSRYSNRQSPDPREEAYRSDRRHHGDRYERYAEGDMHRPPPDEGRSPYRPRSRSPLPPPPMREDEFRSRGGYDRYGERPRSRGATARSRSPRGYARDMDSARDMHAGYGYARPQYAGSHWPESRRMPPSPPRYSSREAAMSMDDVEPHMSPPPPPPMAHTGSMHGPHYGRASPGYDHGAESPYRGYSRPSRRASRTPRTPRSGTHGQPHPRPSHGGRYGHEGHRRESSAGGQFQSYGSRGPSPGPPHYASTDVPPPPQPPGPPLPAHAHGTDLFISRQDDAEDWLELRQQLREQSKKTLELSARARKTGFEMEYADWGVMMADGQVQVALWQVERAEQGLGATDRSLIDSMHTDL